MTNHKTILAINPGSRELGIAIFADQELIHCRVRTITGYRKSKQILTKMSSIINQYVAEFQPEVLALETPVIISRRDRLVASIVDRITTIASKQNLTLIAYTPQEVYRFFCPDKEVSKREFTRIISTHYPKLARYFERNSPEQMVYWRRMFDAVALGYICQQTIIKAAPTTTGVTTF